MKILIDMDEAGHPHILETDASLCPMALKDPAGGAAPLNVMQLLATLNANPAFRTQGGWDVQVHSAVSATPQTRWARVVAACNAPNAPADHKALNLK